MLKFVGIDWGNPGWRDQFLTHRLREGENNLKPGEWAVIKWHWAGNTSNERAAFTDIGNKSFEA